MTEKMAEFFNLLFGFRKFLLMMLLFLAGIIFRLKGYVNGTEFVELMKGTAIAFFSANSLEHLSTTVKEYINSKGQKSSIVTTDVGSTEASKGE